jgi:hypothetical protein
MAPHWPELYAVGWPMWRESPFILQARSLYHHEFRDMPTEAHQNAPQPAAPPALVTCNPNGSVAGSTLECLVRRPPNLAYNNAPLASTVIAPSTGERHPYGAEGGRND